MQELSGVWVNKDGAKLILKEDGTMVGDSLPGDEIFIDTGYTGKGLRFSGIGKWEINKSDLSCYTWEIKLDIDIVSPSSIKVKEIPGETLGIEGNGFFDSKAPWKGIVIVEDPDDCVSYKFNRQTE